VHETVVNAFEDGALERFAERKFVVGGRGETIPDMPLFLEPNGCIMVPLEATYQTAFAVMPERWRNVIQNSEPGA